VPPLRLGVAIVKSTCNEPMNLSSVSRRAHSKCLVSNTLSFRCRNVRGRDIKRQTVANCQSK
jgi:hypothetical protein